MRLGRGDPSRGGASSAAVLAACGDGGGGGGGEGGMDLRSCWVVPLTRTSGGGGGRSEGSEKKEDAAISVGGDEGGRSVGGDAGIVGATAACNGGTMPAAGTWSMANSVKLAALNSSASSNAPSIAPITVSRNTQPGARPPAPSAAVAIAESPDGGGGGIVKSDGRSHKHSHTL